MICSGGVWGAPPEGRGSACGVHSEWIGLLGPEAQGPSRLRLWDFLRRELSHEGPSMRPFSAPGSASRRLIHGLPHPSHYREYTFQTPCKGYGARALREQRKGGVITRLTWKLLSDSQSPRTGGDNEAITGNCAGPESRAGGTPGWQGPSPGHLAPIRVPRPEGHPHVNPPASSRPRDNEAVPGGGGDRPE